MSYSYADSEMSGENGDIVLVSTARIRNTVESWFRGGKMHVCIFLEVFHLKQVQSVLLERLFFCGIFFLSFGAFAGSPSSPPFSWHWRSPLSIVHLLPRFPLLSEHRSDSYHFFFLYSGWIFFSVFPHGGKINTFFFGISSFFKSFTG